MITRFLDDETAANFLSKPKVVEYLKGSFHFFLFSFFFYYHPPLVVVVVLLSSIPFLCANALLGVNTMDKVKEWREQQAIAEEEDRRGEEDEGEEGIDLTKKYETKLALSSGKKEKRREGGGGGGGATHLEKSSNSTLQRLASSNKARRTSKIFDAPPSLSEESANSSTSSPSPSTPSSSASLPSLPTLESHKEEVEKKVAEDEVKKETTRVVR